MNKSQTRGITQRFLQICAEVVQEGHAENRKEFAISIGEHQQNLSLMDKGSRAPTLEQIATACKKYGYSANWLILNQGNKKLSETVKQTEGTIEQRVNNLETEIARINRKISLRSTDNGLKTKAGTKRVQSLKKYIKR